MTLYVAFLSAKSTLNNRYHPIHTKNRQKIPKNTHVTRPSFNPARKSLPQADFVKETKPVWAFVSLTLDC